MEGGREGGREERRRRESEGRARGAKDRGSLLIFTLHATTVLCPAFVGVTPLRQRGLHSTLPVAAAWSRNLGLPRRIAPRRRARLSHVSLEAKKRIVLKNGACEGKRNARGRGGMGAKGREMFAEECEGFSCAVSLDPCPWGMQSKDAQPVRRTRLLSSAGDAGCTEQCAACRLRSRWRGKGRGRLLQL